MLHGCRDHSAISIHTLHTEGDPEGSIERASDDEFQSTPSTRRVTPTSRSDTWFPSFQSTPSTRRVTALPDQHICPHLISIHTLHTEGDFGLKAEFSAFIIISIHTLHTEGDARDFPKNDSIYRNFNPHPPHGG